MRSSHNLLRKLQNPRRSWYDTSRLPLRQSPQGATCWGSIVFSHHLQSGLLFFEVAKFDDKFKSKLKIQWNFVVIFTASDEFSQSHNWSWKLKDDRHINTMSKYFTGFFWRCKNYFRQVVKDNTNINFKSLDFWWNWTCLYCMVCFWRNRQPFPKAALSALIHNAPLLKHSIQDFKSLTCTLRLCNTFWCLFENANAHGFGYEWEE